MSEKGTKILIIVLVVFILIFGSALAYFANRLLVKAPQELITTDPTYPVDNTRIKKAVKDKNPALCENLKEETKDNCIYAIATQNKDQTFCQLIIDLSVQKKCLEMFVLSQALANNDVRGCLSITDNNFKNQCLTGIFRQQNDLKFCADLELEYKSLCEDAINYNLAFSQKDTGKCDLIKDTETKNECLASTQALLPSVLDSDKDGLPDETELSIGTDPFKADSDGDGISDLAEIKAGTNPLVK